ncbi:hypothetical protein [Longispora albida]|uniref:hypothetical protein n=1 Tax=Longispora albida TaxID=203523 RepID=UPI00036196E3|nr:hypothetical protein [Longispora albida]
MIWWTLLAGFLTGLVLLVLACLPLVKRLKPLQLAVVRLQRTQGDVALLQGRIAEMQETLAVVQQKLPQR